MTSTYLSARQAVIEVGQRLWKRGYVASNDGNISVKVSADLILCTPTGVSKGFMTPDSLALVHPDGTVVDRGTGGGPSSEIKMHLRVYQEDPSVQAVVHAHPPISTAYAVLGEPLEANLLPEIALLMPRVPIAPYATPSTEQVPNSVAPLVADHRVCLLEQHGSLSWADSLEEAYLATERLEYYAQLLFNLHLLGRMRELTSEQVHALRVQFGQV